MMLKPQRLHCFITLLALLAAGWSGYLAYGSYTSDAIAGCGPGSGCAQVLASQWSRWLGQPVAVGAVAVYGSMVIVLTLGRGWSFSNWLLRTLAIVALGSAGWFTFVQMQLINTTCTHCMMVHSVGGLLALLLLLLLPANGGWRDRGALFIGSMMVGVLVIGQLLTPPPATHRVVQSGSMADIDTGPAAGGERELTLRVGQVAARVRVAQYPLLGSTRAQHIVVMLTDYNCVHCKAVHGYLKQLMQQNPQQLAVLLLPIALDGRCNPAYPVDEGRFKTSCELAQLALAVWRADARQFAAFDDWLLTHQGQITLQQARDHAVTLVNPERLEQALALPWASEQLQRNITFFQRSELGRLPALVHGNQAIIGRPGTYAEFVQSLRDDFGLRLAVGNGPR